MSHFWSSNLLCYMTLLVIVMLVIPVPGEEVCEKNEEYDAKGHCCTADLMDGEDEHASCFKLPSQMSVAVAFTLIGSFTFLLSLTFATNSPDETLRKYAYRAISSTVSIFCAVLMFQCINGLVEDLIVEPFGLAIGWQLSVDVVHMLIWYITMQIVMAVSSGAMKPSDKRYELLNHGKKSEIASKKEQVNIGCQCTGGVLAHLTGFASINAWASLQQHIPFNSSPFMACLPLACATLGQITLQWITSKCRLCISKSDDDRKDWFEEKWDETCGEAESDVMGLTLSVITVNALRMAINGMVPAGAGCLPNEEQKEEGEECEDFVENGHRTVAQVFWLFAAGALFVIMLFIVQWFYWKIFPHEESEEEEEEQPGQHFLNVFKITLAMAFSWCIFHADKQLLMVMSPTFLGDEKNACFSHVIHALEATYMSWIIIRILHRLSELPDEYTPPSIDSSIKKVIDAIALFIGFAWEQTFDVSVGSLANNFRKAGGRHAPAIAKFIIATLCCTIVFLAWKWYILPFVFKEGWKFNYVFSGEDLYTAAKSVANHDPEFRDKVLPALHARYGDGEYKALPSEAEATLSAEEKRMFHDKLQKSEAEKEKLQALLGHHVQIMLGSVQAMQASADREILST